MHTPRHPTRSITIMASALLALFLLSFVLGRYGVPLGEVVKILLSRVFPIEQTWTDNMAIAVWNVRLPRILLACLVGCGLSAAVELRLSPLLPVSPLSVRRTPEAESFLSCSALSEKCASSV